MPFPANALIVDDESHVRTFLRMVLGELGIETTWEAANGAEGLQLAEKHRPALILLDLNMPMVGGLDALSYLQQTQPDTPVVVVTSQNGLQAVENAVRLGAAGYILKQNSKTQIVATLRRILESAED